MERSPQSLARPPRHGGDGVLAWMRLARIYHGIERTAAGHVRAWGLSLGRFDVLAQVGAAEGRTQQELADALLVTKGNVCQLLDQLEAAGLVVRRPDGRVKRLYLTEAGRRLRDEVVPRHEAMIAARFAALTPEEQRCLHDLLRKLERGVPPP
jgi:MarR family 2-MHQ and catechol resistance regulon transcriptional repressor